MKFKKANIPIAVLVLGVLAICTLVILSFSISVNRVNFNSISLFENILVKEDQFEFYVNRGYSNIEAATFVDGKIENNVLNITEGYCDKSIGSEVCVSYLKRLK